MFFYCTRYSEAVLSKVNQQGPGTYVRKQLQIHVTGPAVLILYGVGTVEVGEGGDTWFAAMNFCRGRLCLIYLGVFYSAPPPQDSGCDKMDPHSAIQQCVLAVEGLFFHVRRFRLVDYSWILSLFCHLHFWTLSWTLSCPVFITIPLPPPPAHSAVLHLQQVPSKYLLGRRR